MKKNPTKEIAKIDDIRKYAIRTWVFLTPQARHRHVINLQLLWINFSSKLGVSFDISFHLRDILSYKLVFLFNSGLNKYLVRALVKLFQFGTGVWRIFRICTEYIDMIEFWYCSVHDINHRKNILKIKDKGVVLWIGLLEFSFSILFLIQFLHIWYERKFKEKSVLTKSPLVNAFLIKLIKSMGGHWYLHGC